MSIKERMPRILPQEIMYPDSDGKPMADNTLQALWIVMLYDNLRGLFASKGIFVAADLLWYPVKGNPKIRVAPDVLIVFNRPDGYRGSYKQWVEDDLPLDVVFEVLSPSNTPTEMLKKLAFYEQYGVSEFIILDPEKEEFVAYTRQNGKLLEVSQPGEDWKSPMMGIIIKVEKEVLSVTHGDGTPFKTFEELKEEESILKEENTVLKFEKEHLEVEKNNLEAEKNAETLAKESALKEIEQLKARLKELGENPE